MRRRPSPWSAVPGIAAPPAVAIGVLAVGLASPGYDPIRRTVSALYMPGHPYALAVAAMIAGLGVAVAWSAVPLVRAHPACRAAAVAMLVAGAGLVAVALVGRDADPGPRTHVHRALAAAALLVLAAAPPLAAWAVRHDPAARLLRRAGIAAALCSLALLAAGLAMELAHRPASGLWERSFVGVELAWLVATQASLLRRRPR